MEDLTIAELFDTSVCGCPSHRVDSFAQDGGCHHCGNPSGACCQPNCPVGELDIRQSEMTPGSPGWRAIMWPEEVQ